MSGTFNFIMNSDKTIQYKFGEPQIIDNTEQYGYICGGINNSHIERISFSLDLAGGNSVGYLSEEKSKTCANNSSEYAYIIGGLASTPIQTIDRLFFPLHSGNANNFSQIFNPKYGLSANNSSCYGYVCGGEQNNTITADIEKFDFGLINCQSNINSTLSIAKVYSIANNSSIYGYICGGQNSNGISQDVERFLFCLDTQQSTISTLVSSQKTKSASNNSQNYGFICGGENADIERIDFSMDSGVSYIAGILNESRLFVSANNSTTYGYVCGGENSNKINRLTFPFSSGTANIHSSLEQIKSESSAADGIDFVHLFSSDEIGPGPDPCLHFQYDPNTDTGYYGFVPTNQLISGVDLADAIGLTAGTSHNSDAGWLKYYSHGKTLFVAKKSFRYGLSWNNIYDVGAVYGIDSPGPFNNTTTQLDVNQYLTITINGITYIVRLMTGAYNNPFVSENIMFDCTVDNNLGLESEWNELIYRNHQFIPDCITDGNETHFHGGNQIGSNWEIYTNDELNIGNYESSIPSTYGSVSWVQETRDTTPSRRLRRGYGLLSGFGVSEADDNSERYGWRPILEIVP